MAKIYELVSGQLCLYVGKTLQSLQQREREHRCNSNRARSKHIPDYTEWEIKLIEECDGDISTAREQYWYDIKKPLFNYQRPGQPRKEACRVWRQTEAGKECGRKANQRQRDKKRGLKEHATQSLATPIE